MIPGNAIGEEEIQHFLSGAACLQSPSSEHVLPTLSHRMSSMEMVWRREAHRVATSRPAEFAPSSSTKTSTT